ncbi:MAG: beta-N-acetylglucosaminidase domain-containing protein [Clostridiales bacterium]|nr:beta-N-acetylglucosaminidase domain-containing protein [Clostridiales bacterium]
MILDNAFLPSGAELFPELIGPGSPLIVICPEDSRRVRYDETVHRVTDEKFIINITKQEDKNHVHVLCSGEKSAFYALSEIARRLDEDGLVPGEFACSPRFAVRGFIEGFYGAPWSHENRLSVLSLMAAHRMNTVYYAPKDDLYHRELWRELYPEDELRRLKSYAEAAASFHMSFVWCISPGLSIRYAAAEDFCSLMTKTRQLYDSGIRSFGLLLDDISGELKDSEDRQRYGELVNAHIDLICRYYQALEDLTPGMKLTVCPTIYQGDGSEYYISRLCREIPPGISVFWTGRDICSRELTCREAMLFFEHTLRKPLYWDNYPVNDMAMSREMHIGPLIGREDELWRYSEGLIANAMEYAECSKIPLITIADYLWQGERYDPEKSWIRAVGKVVGKENTEAFLTFADHLRVSCLMDENSPHLKQLFTDVGREYSAGRKDPAGKLAADYLARMQQAVRFLHKDVPICRELAPWARKFEQLCGLLPAVFSEMESAKNQYSQTLREMTENYASVPWRLAEESDLFEAADGGYSL